VFDGKKLPPAAAVVDPTGLRWISDVSLTGTADSLFYVVHERQGGSWYLGRRKGADGTSVVPAARAGHYAIDTTIRKNQQLRGETTIDTELLRDGVRVLPLTLLGKLRIQEAEVSTPSIGGGGWTAATIVQEGKDDDSGAAVVLPKAVPRGEKLRLR